MSFRPRTRVFLSTCVALLLASLAAPAGAAEITAFFSGARPGQTWGRGVGGAFTISFFDLVHGEIEGASQGADFEDTRLLTATAKAYLGPNIGRFVPYAGLGAGFYHLGLPGDDDSGRHGLLFIGAKLHFPVAVVLRAELQWVDLPDDAPFDMDERYFVGVGLRF